MPAQPRDRLAGTVLMVLALASMNAGAAFAKQIFTEIGASATTGLRVGISALILLAYHRPWRFRLPATAWRPLVVYGVLLGTMNACAYQAFARLPIGIAVAIEIIGPMVIVLLSSRRALDLVWFGLAATGLFGLLPIGGHGAVPWSGVAFALSAASCWALYILAGKWLARSAPDAAIAWGMVVAAITVVPLGLADRGWAMVAPPALANGLGLALLSSALAYSLELAGMRRLPTPIVGILASGSPAIAALCGYLFLDERLSGIAWLSICAIMIATAGAAYWHREPV